MVEMKTEDIISKLKNSNLFAECFCARRKFLNARNRARVFVSLTYYSIIFIEALNISRSVYAWLNLQFENLISILRRYSKIGRSTMELEKLSQMHSMNNC